MAYKLKANLFQKAMIGAAPVMTAWEGYSYGRDKNGEFEGDSKKQLKELGKSAAFGGAIGAALNSDFFGNTSGSKRDIAAAKIKKRYDKKLMSGVQLPDSELKSLNNANKRLVGYGGWTGRKMKGRLKAAGSNAALTLGIGALGWAGGKLMNKRNQNKQNQIQAGEYDKELRELTKELQNKPFDAGDLAISTGAFTAAGLGAGYGAKKYFDKKAGTDYADKIADIQKSKDNITGRANAYKGKFKVSNLMPGNVEKRFAKADRVIEGANKRADKAIQKAGATLAEKLANNKNLLAKGSLAGATVGTLIGAHRVSQMQKEEYDKGNKYGNDNLDELGVASGVSGGALGGYLYGKQGQKKGEEQLAKDFRKIEKRANKSREILDKGYGKLSDAKGAQKARFKNLEVLSKNSTNAINPDVDKLLKGSIKETKKEILQQRKARLKRGVQLTKRAETLQNLYNKESGKILEKADKLKNLHVTRGIAGAGIGAGLGLAGMAYNRYKRGQQQQNQVTSAEANRDLADLGIIGTMGGLGVASGAVQNHFTRKSNFEKNKKLAKEALDRAEKLEKGQVQPNTYDYTTKNGTKGTSVENAATHRKYAANLNNKHSKINLKTGMNKTKWGLAGAGLATAGVALSRYNQYRNNKKLQQSSNQYN